MSANPKIAIAPEVRAILEKCWGQDNLLHLPPGQLDRKLYDAVNKHIVACGGKWNKGKKAHVFPAGTSPIEAIGLALEKGHTINEKVLLQAFYTPAALAKTIVETHLDLQPHHRCLEPSAGEGAFVKAMLNAGATPQLINAVELNDKAAKQIPPEVPTIIRDFLTVGCFPYRFDRIAMNPPFTKDQDIAHVRHAWKMLRPKGKLVAIMAGNQNRAKFHEMTREMWAADVDTIIKPLPEGAFKESGTTVNTLLLIVTNP